MSLPSRYLDLQRRLIGPLCLFGVCAFSLPAGASAGWYLLSPPLRASDEVDELIKRNFPEAKNFSKDEHYKASVLFTWNLHAPLSQWGHSRSFDTAGDCEAARQHWIDQAKHDHELAQIQKERSKKSIGESPPVKSPEPIVVGTELVIPLAEGSRCIASDDPRLLAP